MAPLQYEKRFLNIIWQPERTGLPHDVFYFAIFSFMFVVSFVASL